MAAELIRRLPDGWVADAYPMLGDGRAFAGLCAIVGPRAHLPSEGARQVKGSVWRDMWAGQGLVTISAIGFLRRARAAYERIIVIGDSVGPILCALSGVRADAYVDVYRSGYGRTYGRIDLWAIRRAAAQTFCRAQTLADRLRAAGIVASAPGNLMMDCIPYAAYDAKGRHSRPLAVALLPGSRDVTVHNFALQIAAIRNLDDPSVLDLFCALAPGVDAGYLSRAAGLAFAAPAAGSEKADAGTATDGPVRLFFSRGTIGNIVGIADIVLSQAGTATVQAIGLGKPVISVQRDTTVPRRRQALDQLYGDARIGVPEDVAELTAALEDLIADPADRARRGAIGRAQIGAPGAMATILDALLG